MLRIWPGVGRKLGEKWTQQQILEIPPLKGDDNNDTDGDVGDGCDDDDDDYNNDDDVHNISIVVPFISS